MKPIKFLVIALLLTLTLTACGGGSNSGENGENTQTSSSDGTTITIEGDIQHSMNADTKLATIESNGFEDIVQLYFNENTERVVSLMLPVDAATGEYTIATNDVTALYLDNSGESNMAFTSISGTLNLTRESNTFSGTFTFDAEQPMPGEGQPVRVKVSGSFSDMTLQNTGS